jgi:fructokinase
VPNPLIIVAGESLVDRIARPDGSVEEAPGGGPFNTARALGRLGRRVAFLGRISTDERGRRLRQVLADAGVDLTLVVETSDPTLVAEATLDAAGVASYRFGPVVNAAAGLRREDVPERLPDATVALHVGTLGLLFEPTAPTIADLVERVDPTVLVMADPNIRPAAITDVSGYRARLQRVLARADVVKVSSEDLAWLAPGRATDDAMRQILLRPDAVGLVTDGPSPVHVVWRTGLTLAVPVPAVTVVDTVGAGDAFSAGFLAAMTGRGRDADGLRDHDAVRDAVSFAIRVGTETVRRRGAEPPTRAQLDRVTAAHGRTADDPMR